jgi:predicted neuraminidase
MTERRGAVAYLAALLWLAPVLGAAQVVTSPGPEYADTSRRFQGIPGIERARNGRLWAVWYGGDTREGPQNYVVVVTSGDDGRTWSQARLVVDPPGFTRAFDASLWHDPAGRLWLFWTQAPGHWDGRGGVWAITTSDSVSDRPRWSAPRRIADGLLLNKPLVRGSGEWLLPIAIGTGPSNLELINKRDQLGLTPAQVAELSHEPGPDKGTDVFSSTDQGKTFRLVGRAPYPGPNAPNEHMLIERKDGSLWMLARTRDGIGSSTSNDGGRTWSQIEDSGIPHPVTRFHIRRLRSGRLLLVRHAPPGGAKTRSHLVAQLSDDDGRTWSEPLMLDDRQNVSYPDAVEGEGGKIYVVYDHERFTLGEILLATFREQDIPGGKPARALVGQARGIPPELSGDGWHAVEGWHGRDGKPHTWNRSSEGLSNGSGGRTADYVTDEKLGDMELYLEFRIPAKSNSGVYVHGLYEVQILDSHGAVKLGVHDCGAIYERWIDGKGVGGTPPLVNACRPPGEWESFHIWFRAPRFDASGKKTEDARFVKVEHNGVVIHRDVVAPGPTRASLDIPEAPTNPLMIQGDHGPVTLRNIYVRPLK